MANSFNFIGGFSGLWKKAPASFSQVFNSIGKIIQKNITFNVISNSFLAGHNSTHSANLSVTSTTTTHP